MLTATSDFYQLRTPVGHEFTPQRWKETIWAADPGAQRTKTYSSFSAALAMERVQTSPALDQLSVKYWVASPQLAVGGVDTVPAEDDDMRLEGEDTAHCTVPVGALRESSCKSEVRCRLHRRARDPWCTSP